MKLIESDCTVLSCEMIPLSYSLFSIFPLYSEMNFILFYLKKKYTKLILEVDIGQLTRLKIPFQVMHATTTSVKIMPSASRSHPSDTCVSARMASPELNVKSVREPDSQVILILYFKSISYGIHMYHIEN